MVAWVEAKNERAAKSAIVKDWPGKDREWRFINEVEPDWVPTDRFPLSDWSKKRLLAVVCACGGETTMEELEPGGSHDGHIGMEPPKGA
jgi:hypothetical protein